MDTLFLLSYGKNHKPAIVNALEDDETFFVYINDYQNAIIYQQGKEDLKYLIINAYGDEVININNVCDELKIKPPTNNEKIDFGDDCNMYFVNKCTKDGLWAKAVLDVNKKLKLLIEVVPNLNKDLYLKPPDKNAGIIFN